MPLRDHFRLEYGLPLLFGLLILLGAWHIRRFRKRMSAADSTRLLHGGHAAPLADISNELM